MGYVDASNLPPSLRICPTLPKRSIRLPAQLGHVELAPAKSVIVFVRIVLIRFGLVIGKAPTVAEVEVPAAPRATGAEGEARDGSFRGVSPFGHDATFLAGSMPNRTSNRGGRPAFGKPVVPVEMKRPVQGTVKRIKADRPCGDAARAQGHTLTTHGVGALPTVNRVLEKTGLEGFFEPLAP